MFQYTESESNNALSGYFVSKEPLILREFPSKQKRKYLVLTHIIKVFDENTIYTEEEVNDLLINIFPDFVTLRRALIDFKFMEREKDCSKYWINKKRLDT
ncbi:MAG: DUF2087 domain-containing protein [Bacilli bacterium]|nr:DUF2087 domain-containing protein [Bacilli bacterium]MBN2876218.1 DUF2087 domain-containing protein [Bacilli bacterium]